MEDRKFEAKVDSTITQDFALHPEQELRFEAKEVNLVAWELKNYKIISSISA